MIFALILIIVGLLFLICFEGESKKEKSPSIISSDNYEVSYTIDEEIISLQFNNKTKDPIFFSQIEIKYEDRVIISYKNNFEIAVGKEFLMSFSNYENLSFDSLLEIVLYRVGNDREDILNKTSAYICSKDNKTDKDYTSSFRYEFVYANGEILSGKVYHEYQFKNEKAFKNFIYEVETDTDYYGDYENKEDQLIRRFIYTTTYPIPEFIKNIEDNYVKYIEENYEYQCEKIEK